MERTRVGLFLAMCVVAVAVAAFSLFQGLKPIYAGADVGLEASVGYVTGEGVSLQSLFEGPRSGLRYANLPMHRGEQSHPDSIVAEPKCNAGRANALSGIELTSYSSRPPARPWLECLGHYTAPYLFECVYIDGFLCYYVFFSASAFGAYNDGYWNTGEYVCDGNCPDQQYCLNF